MKKRAFHRLNKSEPKIHEIYLSGFFSQGQWRKAAGKLNKGILLLWCGILSGCFYFMSDMRRAEKALEKGDCREAKQFFLLSQDQHKKKSFSRKAAKQCLFLSTKEAVWFYDYLSRREEKTERLLIQAKMAKLYFEELKNYEKAIEIFSFLKNQNISEKKKQDYSFYIALSYFEMGKWEESLNYLDSEERKKTLRSEKKNSLLSFEFEKEGLSVSILREEDQGLFILRENSRRIFLKARIFLMQKKYKEAEQLFQYIKQRDSVYFKKHQIFLYLSFIYELKKNFPQAVFELEKFQSTSEFLSKKIKRLKIRQSHQPGFFPMESVRGKEAELSIQPAKENR